ncbi:MAG TPA: alpha/beta hydrolase fold domain-containing protein [Acidimicrobiales bacterium]|nr:alpha/beta hydrolase fold domain-containing protein [Acidimicrobiales bacterium]
MTSPRPRPPQPPRLPVHRLADMQLRGRTAPLATRVYWPAPAVDAADRRPALLVLFPGSSGDADQADALSRGLCSYAGVVVLTLAGGPGMPGGDDALGAARTTVDWAADHAAELGADARRLVVAGWGSGAGLVAAVAQHACEQGWPPIARQVLIGPDLDTPVPVGGARMAPATVVTIGPGSRESTDDTGRHAARLRGAGVRVDELRYDGLHADDLTWVPWSAGADLLVGDLARSLQHRLGLPSTPATFLEFATEDDAVGAA